MLFGILAHAVESCQCHESPKCSLTDPVYPPHLPFKEGPFQAITFAQELVHEGDDLVKGSADNQ